MSALSEAVGLLPQRPPRVGELVEVRSRRWLVEAVEAADQSASPHISLACADDDAQGQTLEVYWDFEIDRRILEQEAWSAIGARGFDPPRHFGAFLHTLRWNCVTATDPNLFQSPFRAGIKIDAYQMEPLRKALRMPRVNLFIADDTGLGKTIEAGLIARELLLRKKARTLVVAAPASVLEQWKAEMEERFGLLFVILDRAYLTRVRQERGFGVNPWRTHSRFLVSHNLLIDPSYADPMREWLGELLPGSLLILDEAHHAAPARPLPRVARGTPRERHGARPGRRPARDGPATEAALVHRGIRHFTYETPGDGGAAMGTGEGRPRRRGGSRQVVHDRPPARKPPGRGRRQRSGGRSNAGSIPIRDATPCAS